MQVILALSTFLNAICITFDITALTICYRALDFLKDDRVPLNLTKNLLITCAVIYCFAWLLIVPTNFTRGKIVNRVYFVCYMSYIIAGVLSVILTMDITNTRDVYDVAGKNAQVLEIAILIYLSFLFNLLLLFVGCFSLVQNPMEEVVIALP